MVSSIVRQCARESVRERLHRIAQERILILDGAMGSMIQAYRTPSGAPLSEDDFRGLTGAALTGERFRDHPLPLKGCNDLLCLTMPDLVSGIHEAYLGAGADIIETCSFNSNAISLADYGLGEAAYELSAAAARLARKAADAFSTPDKPRFVAGSMGPSSKSASISPDLNDPAKRAVTWDELDAAYYDNARGLLDGGADILIIETIIDTLNAKAAIFAVKRLARECGLDVPIIISASVSGGGRLLSGQTVEAFAVSVLHADPLALGLNCSFGAEKLKAHISALSAAAPCLVSAYPNAGFPNNQGVYDESPETMADHIEGYMREGLVNIVGGCCGSTPAHIAAIADKAKNYAPRPVPARQKKTTLAGLKVLEVNREQGLTLIGERTNAAGSAEFLRLIKEENYDGAAEIGREMAEEGAALLDVCMDNALLDAKSSMTTFLNYALQYPDIASLPLVIDSSDWNVVEAGLKCLQGKGLVNSINLKDGDAEFMRRAILARAYGAAVAVMLIDEQGPAVSYERRIAVATRSWKLLSDTGFPPEDIVFDPNVFAISIGASEDDSDALDFLKSCDWIRKNYPYSQILGGISNLSFGFRGNETIREAFHAVFIKNAVEQGLSMAIVNPAALAPYDEINRELRGLIEDFILKRRPEKSGADVSNQAERFLALAKAYSGPDSAAANGEPNSGGALLPLEKARENKLRLSWPAPEDNGVKDALKLPEIFDLPPEAANSVHIISFSNYPINRVIPYIDWVSIVQTWDLANHTYPGAYNISNLKEGKKILEKLQKDAKILLEKIISDRILSLRGVVGLFPACSEGDDIVVFGPGASGTIPEEAARFSFLRNQERKNSGEPNPCLADFLPPRELLAITHNAGGLLGIFALSAGFGLREAEEELRNRKDDYGALVLAGLANSLVEAFSEEIHHRLRGAAGIRPVFGNPACPDRRDSETAFALLDARKNCGLELTDTAMISPAASLCGISMAHADSFYFSIGSIGEDQMRDWAYRKGISMEEARKRLSS